MSKWTAQTAGSADVARMLIVAQTRQYVSMCEAAAAAWLLYDWLIRLGDEIELIWISGNSPPKCLYFVLRYFGLVTAFVYLLDAIPPHNCEGRIIFRAIAYYILRISLELSLMIRIYALWNQSKTMAMTLAIFFGMVHTCNIVLLSIIATHAMASPVPYPSTWPVRGCFVVSNPGFLRASWLPALFFESLLFVLNTIKCLQYRPLSNTPLMIRLFRDGTVYYCCICIVLLIRTCSEYHSRVGIVMDTFMTAIFSYSGSALMLSIRSLAAKRFQLSVIAPEVPDIAQPYDQAVSDLPSSSPTVGNPLAMSSLHQEPSTAGNSEYVEETVGSTRQRCTCEEGDRCRVHGGPDVGQNVGSEASNVQVPSEISVKTTTSSWARFGRPKLARVPWLDDWNAHS